MPIYTVEDFSATIMDEHGEPDRSLAASELRHYPDETNELESPRLTLFNPSGPPWLMRSRNARLSKDNKLILLLGGVEVDRAPGEANREVRLRTQELLIKRHKNYAKTDQPVRIMSESDWINADTGARIWLGEALRVRLLGRVRGEFAMPQKQDADGQQGPAS